MAFQRAGEGGNRRQGGYQHQSPLRHSDRYFEDILTLGKEFGWKYCFEDRRTGLISLLHEESRDRLDIWITKMTIGYLRDGEYRHSYMYNVPFQHLADIFDDPDKWSRSNNYKKN